MLKLKVLVFLGLLLLSACARAPAATDAPQVPTAVSRPADIATQSAVSEVSSVQKVSADAQVVSVDYCTDCHTDKQKLIDTAKPVEEVPNENKGGSMVWEADPMEPWEKVLVDAQTFPQSIHGLNGCISCHGGVESPDKDTAHEGIIRNPSKDPQAVCGTCHPDIVANHKNNLHSNLAGFLNVVSERTVPKSHPAIDEAIATNCSSCHVTCGECHVSQPNIIGGGFVNGHLFNRIPSMTQNCAACHASRAGNEYLGKNEGLNADVHFAQANMNCVDCHTDVEFHGAPADCNSCHTGPEGSEVPPPDHRYDGIQAPRCETCHANVAAGKDDVIMHQMHGSDLSCQVCHSVAYSNCDGCHVAVSDKTGNPIYELDASYTTFLIGRNPLQSYERPYAYVPVRHAPISQDTFDFYGLNLLPNFDKQETWKYATPHNIQRNTPQTESCNACHGNPEFFLTADKVAPEELKANQNVIVDTLPPLISSGDQIPSR